MMCICNAIVYSACDSLMTRALYKSMYLLSH